MDRHGSIPRRARFIVGGESKNGKARDASACVGCGDWPLRGPTTSGTARKSKAIFIFHFNDCSIPARLERNAHECR